MNKDVLVSVSGTQMSIDGENPIEIISKGQFYRRGDKVYIKYQEIDEEDKATDCLIKVGAGCVEITKKGVMNSCMVFEKDKNCMTVYETPFGNLMIGITTNDLIVLEDEDAMAIKILYMLDINYSYVSECSVDIKIVSQG